MVHRLAKFDTHDGIISLQHAAREDVPYAVLLYERYLGSPFATHRNAVSELVGEVMENAVEDQLRRAGITYRKTKRAERLPGFGQAPDFCIPDEVAPVVIIEAKITSDDGTARDKVARIKELETQRNQHVASGRARYEVVACIDGRGFRERREDMRQMLLRLDGKVFTTASLDQRVIHTRLKEFVTTAQYEQALQPSILIQMSDTGVGISEDDQARIFEPFFSTGKKGTGLGLWVTQDIVRQHGGRIEVVSEVGIGTVFNLILQVEPPVLEDEEKK